MGQHDRRVAFLHLHNARPLKELTNPGGCALIYHRKYVRALIPCLITSHPFKRSPNVGTTLANQCLTRNEIRKTMVKANWAALPDSA